MKRCLTISGFLAIQLLLHGCGGVDSRSSEPIGNEPNILERAVAPSADNPLFECQWYFDKNDAFYAYYGIDPDAHIHPLPTQTYTGRGVKVVIIDDALDLAHEDLQGAVVGSYDVITKTTDVMPRSDDDSHGTMVTGLIGANSNSLGIAGIAPRAELYFIRLPFGDNFSDSMVIEAFYKAKEWGADVINCSWGSGDVSDSVKSVIQDVAKTGRDGKGTIIVFSSGNGGFDGIGVPIENDESGIAEVLAVSSTNIYNERTSYSNYGPELDLLAPGGEYLGLATLDQMGANGLSGGDYLLHDSYYMFTGTSAAAPVVAGVVALLLESGSHLTREDLISILEKSADKVDPSQCNYGPVTGHSIYCGYGKVNIERSITAVLERSR